MATTSISPPSLIDHHEREPPSSFDFSKIANGHNSSTSSYSSASASNVANALNTRPVYDRSTSRLSRYDSKRSSIISNTSFQAAPGFADSAYGGGSHYGCGSAYGTADGGSSRESLNTVQGAASRNISPAPVVNGSGAYPTNNKGHSHPGKANSLKSLRSTLGHPGNDLPAQMVATPSPLNLEVTTARAARVGTPPISITNPPTSQEEQEAVLKTNPTQEVILAETTILSASPSHSPSVGAGEHADGLHAVMRRHSESNADSQPPSPSTFPEVVPRDFGSQTNPTSDLIAPTDGPSSQTMPSGQATSQSYPGSQLLHPSSAASITVPASAASVTNAPGSTKPVRRNTTGSSSMMSRSKSTAASGSSAPATATATAGLVGVVVEVMRDEWDMELDEDMKKQAEQIRRERKRRDLEAQEEERLERERGGKRDSKGKEKNKDKGHSRSGSASARSVGARSTGGKSVDEWKPVVGNVVGEGHVNYILMYNMLTGIRVAVSRCQAKTPRSLTDADYTAAHKYNFDVIGNELTPSAKYDFKFKDYAPWVFRSLREDSFNIDPADYLLSLTSKCILSELGSPGKSGSFFYYSRDYRFIIKTIRAAEHKWLRRVLKDYFRHVRDNPHTLISRFYGLHRVKLPRGNKIHFVIMNNLFPAHRDIHETYDLKGSTVGRIVPQSKLEENPGAVMKDLNWIERGRVLEFGPYKRALLTEQLRRDVEFLKSIGVMDYSLLVGLHSIKRGNKENIRGNTLKVFKPDIKEVSDIDTPMGTRKWIGIKQAMEVRRAILLAQRQQQSTAGTAGSGAEYNSSTAPQRDRRTSLTNKSERGLSQQATSRERGAAKDRNHSRPSPLHTLESSNLPEEDPLPSDRSGFIFYSDDGGYKATDDLGGPWHGGLGGRLVIDGKIVSDEEALEKGQGMGETDGEGVVYYLGVIDILTRWTFVKKVEHFWKGLKADRHKISPVNPPEYGDRFFSFMQAIMRGGEGGGRFI